MLELIKKYLPANMSITACIVATICIVALSSVFRCRAEQATISVSVGLPTLTEVDGTASEGDNVPSKE